MGAAKKLVLEWPDLFKPITGLKPGAYELSVKRETIPIIFVPGIMGTRLKNNRGEKVWDPDAKFFMLRKYGLLWDTAAKKKKLVVGDTFNEDFLAPYDDDADHNGDVLESFPGAAERRWGGVAWSSYGKVLGKLQTYAWSPAIRACFDLPVYAHGYNWSASNSTSGKKLKEMIDQLTQKLTHCKQVILVTHSMGGLVARSASMEHGASSKILGIIHGVQPATGAGAAYWRMKAGFERTDLLSSVAAWVLGSNGEEVTALLGNMPGGLQLLPSHHYTDNSGSKQWLKFEDYEGKVTASRPESGDPYQEIYKNKKDYWRLVNPDYLDPGAKKGVGLVGPAVTWARYEKFIDKARTFHEKAKLQPNAQTQAFYGAGKKIKTVDRVVYRIAEHGWKQVGSELVKLSLKTALAARYGGVWGAGAYLAKEAITHSDWWESRGGFKARITKDDVTLEVTLQPADGGGDGTVPESSGKAISAPTRAFEGIGHEPAYTYETAEQPVLDFTMKTIEKYCLAKIKEKIGG